mmetsp:Transcript_18782/g.60321  ORF Transcript_18782/g.60321 Transcript_18782/m.60321 type:complete len:241 (+) Transcript_18782:25-747(+)
MYQLESISPRTHHNTRHRAYLKFLLRVSALLYTLCVCANLMKRWRLSTASNFSRVSYSAPRVFSSAILCTALWHWRQMSMVRLSSSNVFPLLPNSLCTDRGMRWCLLMGISRSHISHPPTSATRFSFSISSLVLSNSLHRQLHTSSTSSLVHSTPVSGAMLNMRSWRISWTCPTSAGGPSSHSASRVSHMYSRLPSSSRDVTLSLSACWTQRYTSPEGTSSMLYSRRPLPQAGLAGRWTW